MNVEEVSDLLTIGAHQQLSSSVLIAAAVMKEAMADVILTLLLQHTSVETSAAFESVCRGGNIRAVQIFLDVSRTLIIADYAGIAAILSGAIVIVKMLLEDVRLVVKTPSAWLMAAIEHSTDILWLLTADERFKRIEMECIDLVIRLGRHQILESLLTDSQLVVRLPVINTLSYCLDNGDFKSFAILLQKYNIYPPTSIIEGCLSTSKQSFFDALVAELNVNDLTRLARACVNLGLTNHLDQIQTTRTITFGVELLSLAVNNRQKAIMRKLMTSPYNIPVCTVDRCLCLETIQKRYDGVVQMLLELGNCIHHEKCLELSVVYELQATSSYLTKLLSVITPAVVHRAVLGRNVVIAEAVLLKAQFLDPRLILEVIQEPSLLGMLEMICRTLPVNVTWNDYQLVRVAARQKNTVALSYLIANQHIAFNP